MLIFLFSQYGKKLKLRVENNDLNLKDRDTGHALILHMGEVGLLILLFEKIESSTTIPDYPYVISIWSFVQLYIVLLFMVSAIYTYGKMIFILHNNGFNDFKIYLIIFLSVFTIIIFINV